MAGSNVRINKCVKRFPKTMTLLVDMTVSMEVRTSATETVDSCSIAHQVKSKIIKNGIHSFPDV